MTQATIQTLQPQPQPQNATTTAGISDPELSLSQVPDDLIPSFGSIEQAVILTCKITTGKVTLEEALSAIRKTRVKHEQSR